MAGFHQGSKCSTKSDDVRLRPVPPAFKEIRKIFKSSLSLNSLTIFTLLLAFVLPSKYKYPMLFDDNSPPNFLSTDVNCEKISTFLFSLIAPFTIFKAASILALLPSYSSKISAGSKHNCLKLVR